MKLTKEQCGICAECVPQVDGGSGFTNCVDAHAAETAGDKLQLIEERESGKTAVTYKGVELLTKAGLELIRDGVCDATELESMAMASALLELMEQQSVAWRYRYHNGLAPSIWKYADSEQECNSAPNYQRQPLYAAPQLPQPVVGDGRDQFEEWFKFHYGDEHSIIKLHRANGGANYSDQYVDLAWIAWKDSRAAMLHGADCCPAQNRIAPAQDGNSPVIPDGLNIRAVAALREAVRNQWLKSEELADKVYWKSMHDIANEIVSAMLQGAEPVRLAYTLPAGWVAVPVEPTGAMYQAGDRQLTTKDIWDAMIAAAPQEVR